MAIEHRRTDVRVHWPARLLRTADRSVEPQRAALAGPRAHALLRQQRLQRVLARAEHAEAVVGRVLAVLRRFGVDVELAALGQRHEVGPVPASAEEDHVGVLASTLLQPVELES